jgi:hypothetical protein
VGAAKIRLRFGCGDFGAIPLVAFRNHVVEPPLHAPVKRFEAAADELGVSVEAAPKSLQVRWRGPDEEDRG